MTLDFSAVASVYCIGVTVLLSVCQTESQSSFSRSYWAGFGAVELSGLTRAGYSDKNILRISHKNILHLYMDSRGAAG